MNGNTVFAYLFEGKGTFAPKAARPAKAEDVVVFTDGDGIEVKADRAGVRFILVSGPPLNEPVAWRGPIVMNTEKELDLAFEEYWSGKFIKGDG